MCKERFDDTVSLSQIPKLLGPKQLHAEWEDKLVLSLTVPI